MNRRQFTSKQKLQIVLEGLSEKISIACLCNQYQISQSQYYKWRDQLLSNGTKAFETTKDNAHIQRLENEIEELKSLIGELTVELKKSGYL